MRTRVITSITTAAVAAALVPAGASAGTIVIGGEFLSPSGNIACMLSSDGVRCDIAAHTYKAPPTPKNCHLAYGDSVGVGRTGRGYLVCHGDTIFGDYPKLAYGKSITAAGFTCSSATTGITCKNKKDGHGFSISKESYRLF